MPTPIKGESKKEYLARFMRDGEARTDFPDEKQRMAVAHSMFEKRNAADMYGRPSAEHPWPKLYKCSFIEPGVVFYQDLGACKACGDKASCEQCEPEGATVLVKQDALAKMAPTFVGRPVINKVHEDVTPSTVADGEADGIVTKVWLDDKSGWWMCEFLVWDVSTQQNCESQAYSVSCAYEPTEVDSAGGEYHNIPYSEDILNGEYTHLAIVTNPRYEGARIFVNSKGGSMSWRFWEKGSRKNASPIDPKAEKVNVDGKDVSLQELYDALPDEAPKFNDDMILDTPKGEKTVGELKQNYINRAKKNAEDAKAAEEKKNAEAADKACPTCGEKKNLATEQDAKLKDNGAEGAEAGGSAKGPLNEAPLPDLRDRKNDDALDAAKKLEATPMKRDLQLEQADGDAKKDEEKKNADDEAAKKEELKQADEDALKKLQEKRNAGRRSFEALRNARGELRGDAVRVSPVAIEERLEKGRSKYGSAA